MEYNKLVAVTGLSGLFELISSKTDGAIVKSLEDGTTKFAATRRHQFSHIESIEIYTTGDNVNLAEVLKVMEGSSEPLPDVKNDKAVRAYFQKVYPSMDFERVYTSDMKKMVKWLDIIKKNNIEIELPKEEVEEKAEVKAEVKVEAEVEGKVEVEEEKKVPAKKTAVKKTAPKKTTKE
ncbi:MAG TPA: DUF5606 domain-containing protein [Niabella sp.]|nr:DUF5606 domain-containing protein [Chitinophagaceae bacterium]HRO83825.1 DUF5606 domain-containing protein [Niabella sp.]